MNGSKLEELISMTTLCAALLAFNGGYRTLGWILAIKSILDTLCSVFCALREIKREKQERGEL